MKNITKFIGEQINSICTKFYYKGQKLCFQIIVSYGPQQLIFYRNFDDYKEYQSNYDLLKNAINSNAELLVDFLSPHHYPLA